MSNWGKAHINNSNGFGAAAVNNDGFGSVYSKSNSGDTKLLGNPPYFAMTIDSTETGVSNNDQFQFTGAQGEYDVDAVQNDVVVQSYTGLNNEATIQLPSAGIYQVRVKPSGTNPFNQIKFDNGGDRDKVLSIDSFGVVKWSTFRQAFSRCSNLATSETNPDLTNVTDMFGTFSGFSTTSVFNGNIGGWNTSNVTTMSFMLDTASSFKQDISAWNIEKVIGMTGMFNNVDMNIANTTTNYDNLLIKWSQQNVQQNVPFDAGNSKYNPSTTLPGYSVNAAQARQILVNNGWTITDGGTI